jgi:hypothetical protein
VDNPFFEQPILNSPYAYPQRAFVHVILESLRVADVQQAHGDDRITFTSLTPWQGQMSCAEGQYVEGGEAGPDKRVGILIGPELSPVTRPQSHRRTSRNRRRQIRCAHRLRLQV